MKQGCDKEEIGVSTVAELFSNHTDPFMSPCTSQSSPATSTDPEIHLSQAQLTAVNNNMNNESWTPLPFDLRLGTPFTYSDRAISQISNTEAFNTGIDLRDGDQCIVCGVSHYDIVQHAPIIPQVEYDTVCLSNKLCYLHITQT